MLFTNCSQCKYQQYEERYLANIHPSICLDFLKQIYGPILTISPTGLYQSCLYVHARQTIRPTVCRIVCVLCYADGKLETQACFTGQHNRQCKLVVT
jgi:hypothetical protein